MSNPSYEEEMWNATERFWNSSPWAQRLVILCNVEAKSIAIRNLEVRAFDMLPTSIQIDIRQEFGEVLKETYSQQEDAWWEGDMG